MAGNEIALTFFFNLLGKPTFFFFFGRKRHHNFCSSLQKITSDCKGWWPFFPEAIFWIANEILLRWRKKFCLQNGIIRIFLSDYDIFFLGNFEHKNFKRKNPTSLCKLCRFFWTLLHSHFRGSIPLFRPFSPWYSNSIQLF